MSLLLAKEHTHGVLEIATYFCFRYPLVDDGKTEMMAVGGGAVACQSTDTRNSTGLSMNIALRLSAFHAIFQGSIDTSDGKGRIEFFDDFGVFPCITQQLQLHIGGDIVIQRQSAAVGNMDE